MRSYAAGGARPVQVEGSITGLAVLDQAEGVKFYSGLKPYSQLDGRAFGSFEEALATARDLFRRERRRRARRESRPVSELTAELALAAPGPLLQIEDRE